MTLHALRVAGFVECQSCLVVPMATGMSLVLTMLALKRQQQKQQQEQEQVELRRNPQYIVWPRIDQKTCFKSIHTAGFTPLVVDMKLNVFFSIFSLFIIITMKMIEWIYFLKTENQK